MTETTLSSQSQVEINKTDTQQTEATTSSAQNNTNTSEQPKMVTITKESCRKSAQVFNVGSIIATISAPLIIPMILWIGWSIFVHARVGHHPDDRVRNYNLKAGYRFYGAVGFLTLVVPLVSSFFDNKMFFYFGIVYGSLILAVIPLSIRDIIRAKNETWSDMTVNAEDF